MTEVGPRQGTILWDLARLFLKLGVTSFGGPAVHIAMMEQEVGKTALTDWVTLLLAVIAAFLLLRFRVNSVWLVLGGAVIGVAMSVLRS